MEYKDQNRMTWNHEEGSKLEWICTIWVPLCVLSVREREREREHNTSQTRKGKKRYNVCMKNA